MGDIGPVKEQFEEANEGVEAVEVEVQRCDERLNNIGSAEPDSAGVKFYRINSAYVAIRTVINRFSQSG